MVSVVTACASATPPEPDILELAARSPLGQQVQSLDGTWRTTRFGDSELERAERDLRIPRPWTVSKMLLHFQKADSLPEKDLLLRVLAASRDPRAAVVLGETLPDEDLDLRVAAAEGPFWYFLEFQRGGNLESVISQADEWWRAHEPELRAEAARLARPWPGN